jgi:hypothetical protein
MTDRKTNWSVFALRFEYACQRSKIALGRALAEIKMHERTFENIKSKRGAQQYDATYIFDAADYLNVSVDWLVGR